MNNDDFKKYQTKMNVIRDYFKETMESKVSKKGVDYLNSRGFDSTDIKKYNVSFIDSDIERFQKYCKKNEIDNQDLKRLGFMSSNGNFLFKNRILFQGGAGTGKTHLALEISKSFTQNGNVLLICFNRGLKNYLKNQITGF